MNRISKTSLSRSAVAAYLCVCVALLVVLALTLWGADRDLDYMRTTLLKAEIDQVRSYAQRTVDRIERDLYDRAATGLEDLEQDGWLQSYWENAIPGEKRQYYGAVVNSNSTVLFHSDATRMGQQLPSNWYRRILSDVGDDVVETRNSALALDKLAYDVRVPIEFNGEEVGSYHAGFDVEWFEKWAMDTQAPLVRRRTIIISCTLVTVLLATSSLFYIATHSISLRRAVDLASIERATEVGRLAAGLAHEIRNPLHAIQLNLHTFQRSREREIEIAPEEMAKMLEQSTREINRIDQLMHQLVAFATPEDPRTETINLSAEISDAVDFIQQEMVNRSVEVTIKLPTRPVRTSMDRGRLRQILLNLLQNAQQAMEDGGSIEISLTRRKGLIELTVADDGPGIPNEDHRRVFEAFYSTNEGSSGLGLALVKRFVEEMGGDIRCEGNRKGGATFRITLYQDHS